MNITYADYIVIGSGAAGLFGAIHASCHGRVRILTRGRILDSNSAWAQGGIAAAVGPGDSPELHFQDTLAAGHGACSPKAVRALVEEGVARFQELARMGVAFDRDGRGVPRLAREGAHSLARVIPAQGDATGLEISSVLALAAQSDKNIAIHQNTRALEILVHRDRAVGVLALDGKGEPFVHLGRAVVLATGGCGHLFQRTTNTRFCNGEGIAMAFRAGAGLTDLEYVQFHPTALASGEHPLPLISEAVRGHGAWLVDHIGRRFMPDEHPQAELAPRDVVARAILERQAQGPVYLDATRLHGFKGRFPSIHAACLKRGLNPEHDLLPVTPAAHFLMGGVTSDLEGRTTLKGLWACGEVAGTGVHGANRLASNSLLECLVFSGRAARSVREAPPLDPSLRGLRSLCADRVRRLLPPGRPGRELDSCLPGDESVASELIPELQGIMWRDCGLVRSQKGLIQAGLRLARLERRAPAGALEFNNMLSLARLMVAGALARKESRGGHFRKDYPGPQRRLAGLSYTFRQSGTPYEPIAAHRDC